MNKKLVLAMASLLILPGWAAAQSAAKPPLAKEPVASAEKSPARATELPADYLAGWYKSPDLCGADADLTLAMQAGKLTVSEKNGFVSQQVDVTPGEEGFLLQGWGNIADQRTDLKLQVQLTAEKLLIASGLPSGGGKTMAVMVTCDKAATKAPAPAAKPATEAPSQAATPPKPNAPTPVTGK